MNDNNGMTLDPSTAVGITFGIVSAGLAFFAIVIAWRQLKLSALITFTMPRIWPDVSSRIYTTLHLPLCVKLLTDASQPPTALARAPRQPNPQPVRTTPAAPPSPDSFEAAGELEEART